MTLEIKNAMDDAVRVRELEQRVTELETQLRDSERSLSARFDELAEMTRLMEQQRQELIELKESAPFTRRFKTLHSMPSFPLTPWYVRWFRRAKARVPQRAVKRIEDSGYFDAQWYLAQYPELASNNLARSRPALHYLKVGGLQGYDPGPGFDSQWYLDQYPDVKAIAVNPLLHYLLHGADEGRKIRPHQASQVGT